MLSKIYLLQRYIQALACRIFGAEKQPQFSNQKWVTVPIPKKTILFIMFAFCGLSLNAQTTCADCEIDEIPPMMVPNPNGGIDFEFGDTLVYTCGSLADMLFSEANVIVTDNCAVESVEFFDALKTAQACQQTYYCIWEATDLCGNIARDTVCVVFNTSNKASGDISCPADAVIACGDDISPEVLGEPGSATCIDPVYSYTDNVVVLDQMVSGACKAIERTWTVEDLCDTYECVQTIYVVDDEAPVLACPTNLELVDCGYDIATIEAWLASATATDDCFNVSGTTAATVTHDFTGVAYDFCASESVQTVTFTATDDCGNTSTCTADILFTPDSEAPTLVCPEPAVFNCEGDFDADITAWLAFASATDNCTEAITVTHDFDGVMPFVCSLEDEGATVTFIAEDACGNETVCTSTFRILDASLPVISGPNPLTISCDTDAAVIEEWLAAHTAEEGCQEGLIVTHDFAEVGVPTVCGTDGLVIITFTTMDKCGNTKALQNTITLFDTEAPVLTCPATLALECGFAAADITAWLATASATDNCSGVVVTNDYVDAVPTTCGADAGVTVTFTATDDCGNTSTCTSTIVLVDEEAPVLVVPVTIIVGCDYNEDQIAFWLSGATATDNCTGVVVTNDYAEVVPSICGEEAEVIVTFTATDACGNTATSTSNIVFLDDEAPVLTCPATLSLLDCNNVAADITAWLATASATDNCSDVVVTNDYIDAIPVTCGADAGVIVTFTATDDCGNTSTCTSTIVLTEQVMPFVGCPEDLIISCGDNTAAIDAWLASVTAIDNCTENLVVTNNYVPAMIDYCVPGENTSIEVTFTTTDDCGNTGSCTGLIIIESDATPPVIVCPDDFVLTCGTPLEGIADWLATATATDICSGVVEVTNDYTDELPLCVDGPLAVTFTATDACGNTSTCTSNLVYVDNEVPVLNCPGSLNLICGYDPAEITNWLASVTATDNCGVGEVTNDYVPGMIDICANPAAGTTVTFVATDICGNVTVCTNQIVVTPDDTAPLIACPNDLVLACDYTQAEITTWLNSVTAADDCEGVVITNNYANAIPATCGADAGVTVTFTATDACGNASTCTSTIVLDDGTAPTVACPADLVISCGDNTAAIEAWIAGVTATDNCAGDLVVTNDYVPAMIDYCVPGEDALIEVTFSTTDACGNTGLCTGFIMIDSDTTPPVVACPNDLVLTCDYDPADVTAWLNSATATDNCADVTVVNNYAAGPPIPPICGVEASIPVTFTATDACGNTSTCIASIFLEDSEAPVLNCPEPLILACGADPTVEIPAWLASVSAIDECGDVMEITNDYTSIVFDLCANPMIATTVTFTATDFCGNVSVCTSQIMVTPDEVAPVVNCSDDLILTCGYTQADIDAWLGLATATDDCNGDLVVINNYDPTALIACGAEGGISVTFTATDACGNTSSCTASIILDDSEAPQIVCPADLVLTCGYTQAEIDAWLTTATASDACDGDVIVANDYDGTALMACGENGSFAVTFTAIDDCGNSTNCTANVILNDETAPTIACPADLVLECGYAEAEITAWLATATASDDCDADVLVSNDYVGYVFDVCSPEGGTLTVTFTATDDCGNTANCTANIILLDEEAPVIACATDLTLPCTYASADITAWLATVTATDNCDDAVVITNTLNAADLAACGAGATQIVTFTATDACGNAATCTASITIVDEEAPVIACPATLTLTCGYAETALEAWLASATATDNCSDNLVVSNNFDADLNAALCAAQGAESAVFTVTFTSTDNCDNTASCTADIVVVPDTEAPTMTCAPDLTISCNTTIAEVNAWLGITTAVDNCTEAIAVSNNFAGILPTICGAAGQVAVTFTATDACGNAATCSANIVLEDEVNPVVACPENLTVSCGDNTAAIAAWLASATATDNCTADLVVTNNYTPTMLDYCIGDGNNLIEVTFSTTDACGNVGVCNAYIIVELDTTPPVIACAADLTLTCGYSQAQITNWLASVTATDNCAGAVTITNNYDANTTLECGANGGFAVLFTATDACGNSSICSANIMLDDMIAPEIACVADLTLTCGYTTAEINAWLNSVTASDACDSNVSITNDFVGDNIPVCDANGGILITFTAMDDCGNAATCTASIILNDDEAPVIACPTALNLTCGYNPMLINNWLNDATATDNCDSDVTITNDFDANNLSVCDNAGGLVVTFTAMDDCGNSTTCTSSIILTDDTAPVIACASDLTLTCGYSQAQITVWLSSVMATDDCTANVTITNDYTASNLMACTAEGSVAVTFTATDDCGNASTCTANITVTDNVAPTIACAANLNLDCGNYTNAEITTWLNSVVASDNCGGAVTITNDYNAANLGACGAEDGYLVTFTATDACGNASTCSRSIVISDNESPVLACAANLTLDCNYSQADITAWLAGVTATDNCTENITVTNNYSAFALTACGANNSVQVTFTATDACGNAGVCSATITVTDETAPVIACPAPLTLSCGLDEAAITNWLASATATDNCTNALTVINNYNAGPADFCATGNNSTVVTFSVMDACGNMASCTSTITVVDEVAPVINCPGDLTLSCGYSQAQITNWLASVTATDNCGAPAVTNNYVLAELGPCGVNGGIPVVFTATDACGNTSTCTANLIINDTEPPLMVCPPDLTLTCGYTQAQIDNWLTSVNASDNCDNNVTLTNDFMGGLGTVCGENGTRVVTFTATDDCGNSSTCTSTIFLNDTEMPNLSLALPDGFFPMFAFGDTLEFACSVIPLMNVAFVEAFDNCDNDVTIEFCEEVVEEDDCKIVYECAWKATDDCGNVKKRSVFVSTDKTVITGVQLTCPPPAQISCEQVPPLPALTGEATGYGCTQMTTSYVDDLSGLTNCNGTGTIIRTWTAQDQCGQTATCQQLISVIDNTPPSIVMNLPDGFVEAVGVGSLEFGDTLHFYCDTVALFLPSYVIATDNCDDDVEVQFIDFNVEEDACSTFMECGWTATDDCGNTTTETIFILVERKQDSPLTISCPGDITVDCGASLDPATTGTATALGCLSGDLFYTDDTAGLTNCGGTGFIVRTWSGISSCGELVTCQQIITIEASAPVLSCPADITIICGNPSPGPQVTGSATVTGICDENTIVSFEDDLSNYNVDCVTDGFIVRTWTATNACGMSSSCTQIIETKLSGIAGGFVLRAALQGAYTGATAAGKSAGTDGNGLALKSIEDVGLLMRDDLRGDGLLPMAEPNSTMGNFPGNTGGEVTNSAILAVDGADAIVDWVVVELRDANDATQIVAQCNALIQRDGDIVDCTDGTSALNMNVPDGDYYIAIRHRNHLGVMTSTPITKGANAVTVDFTNPATPTWGTHAQIDMGGVMALYGGDTNGDGQLIYQGVNAEPGSIFFMVVAAPNNPDTNVNYAYKGYENTDVDLNCYSIYQGDGGENPFIFFNVLTHPANVDSSPIFIISEQLAK